MSLAENWRKELTELANDRSTPAIVRPGERAPAQTNVRPDERALGERSPRPANVRTRGQITRQARGQLN
jgi:hypothetical protein